MRLAYLCNDPGVPYGGTKGSCVHMAELAGALAAEGAEVLLLVAEVHDPAAPAGVTVERLPGLGKRADAADRLAADPALGSWLAQRLSTFEADILYERLGLHSAAGSAVPSALGVRHLVELNAPLAEEAAAYRTADEAHEQQRRTLSRADLVFAVSTPLAGYAASCGAHRVEVMPNAVSVERFAPAAHRDGTPLAVFCGTLRPWHGVDAIAAAWRLLGSAAPDLLVVGDGPGRERLEAVGAQVTGAVAPSEVPALLASADIGLAPHARDAPVYVCPLKVFEYLAAELAVVAAALPGVTDAIDRDAAMLIPPGDGEALAVAVAGLTRDPERRRRLGRAGRELVAAHHTWHHRARRVLGAAWSLRAEVVRS